MALRQIIGRPTNVHGKSENTSRKPELAGTESYVAATPPIIGCGADWPDAKQTAQPNGR
jgi:hypothetical protein